MPDVREPAVEYEWLMPYEKEFDDAMPHLMNEFPDGLIVPSQYVQVKSNKSVFRIDFHWSVTCQEIMDEIPQTWWDLEKEKKIKIKIKPF